MGGWFVRRATGRVGVDSVLIMAVLAYSSTIFFVTSRWGWDVGGALVVLPAMVIVSLPLLSRIGQRDPDPRMGRLLVWALLAKIIGTVARYLVLVVLYDGGGDSKGYDTAARGMLTLVRHGSFPAFPATGSPATHWVERFTGVVYALIGPSFLGGFLVFSWLSFWGAVLCTRAVRLCAPGLDAYRYSALLLFLPTILFWPSSIGKEALAVTGIGLSVYGAARIYVRRRGGYLLIALGLGILMFVRPNTGSLVASALIAGLLLGRATQKRRGQAIYTVVTLAVLSVAAVVVVKQAATLFGVESLDVSSLQGTLDEASRRTSEGGSEFTPARVNSPVDLPWAIVTVLFRPFPFEVHNVQALVASAEGMLLFGLFLWRLASARWRRAVWALRRNRLVIASVIFVLGFVLAFSAFGNFGILARQRTQVIPFLLVPLAVRTQTRPSPSLTPSRYPALTARST